MSLEPCFPRRTDSRDRFRLISRPVALSVYGYGQSRTTQRPRLAKLKRAASNIGAPYTSLRDAGMRGEFPIVRIGRALYVENRDLDRWIEMRKQTA